jgi:hypothetical protein
MLIKVIVEKLLVYKQTIKKSWQIATFFIFLRAITAHF